MDTHASPPVRSFLPAAIILMVVGWGGLAFILTQTTPNGGTRWALFFTAILAITGLFLPGMAFLNRRFPSTPAPGPAIVLRQALWMGVYFPTLAWLQQQGVLNPRMALLLALGLVLIEWLLRLRERSQWKP